MWSSLKKNFSPWRSPSQKVGLSTVAPVTPASIEVDNHEKSNKHVIVPQKIFSPWRLASQKVGLDSRPVTLASIEVDNHEKIISMWSSPQKFSPWRSPLKSGSLDSRPVQLASIQVDNHEKSNKYVIVPQKIFSVTLASQKLGLSTVARDTRLYSSW